MNRLTRLRAAPVRASMIALGTWAVIATTASPARAGQGESEGGRAGRAEEIYVLRSIRDRHEVQKRHCEQSAIGFAPYPVDADRWFSFWSIASRADDGLVVDTAGRKVGELHGCFGPTDDRARQNFHAEIRMGWGVFRGRGECHALLVDFPEEGMVAVHCRVVLGDLPEPYVGGLLTTNTLTSSAPFGGETFPPGYTQASIATIRLWARR